MSGSYCGGNLGFDDAFVEVGMKFLDAEWKQW